MTEIASTAVAPGARPLLGHFLALRRDPLGFMESLRGHGDLVAMSAGPLRFVVVCDPLLAHEVMTDLRTYDRTGAVYDRVRRAMGSGVATSAYAEHRRQRLMMQPAFHARHLPGYTEVMREQTAAQLDSWRTGQTIDVSTEMFRLTTSVALRALFSTGLSSVESAKLREAFEVFLRGSYTQIALPAFGRLPLPGNLRYRAALRQWRKQVKDLITGYRAAGGGEDLMARLLAACGEEGEGLTDAELSDQVAVLLLAGGETTSSALTWAVYLLCTHPEVLRAASEESGRVLGGEVGGWEHLPQLDLIGRVMRETLRMYPPSWLLARTATREARLGRHAVPAGTTVLVSQYVLHRDPDVFPEPNRFDPERWAEGARSGAASATARRAYLPFGGGPTKCLGEQFAFAEATLALASILARWTPRLHDARAAEKPDCRLVLAPRHLPVRLERLMIG
ncbi:cytochrome P450 [Actinospica robiniae]|uniref:cytochrome P450 n=1 Tax=Actinospica robiniae TaxID=304901 RepID=UPI000406BC4C|nr:cytochrome P450 [Actinospica robiniae]